MSRERRLLASLAILILVTFGGALGYVVIEGVSWNDALYMTVTTISTVGFGEVFPLSSAGRILTVGLIVVGVGAALYTAATALEITLERFLGGEVRRRRMNREIDRLQDHIIVCGFGRVGRNTWRALRGEDIATVVVEADPDSAESGVAAGALVVAGDATRNEVLEAAGIDRRSSPDRLRAQRQRQPRDRSVGKEPSPRPPRDRRATEFEAQEKLRLAGADRVVSPQLVGAHRLAALAAEPRLDEFVDVILHGRLIGSSASKGSTSPPTPRWPAAHCAIRRSESTAAPSCWPWRPRRGSSSSTPSPICAPLRTDDRRDRDVRPGGGVAAFRRPGVTRFPQGLLTTGRADS